MFSVEDAQFLRDFHITPGDEPVARTDSLAMEEIEEAKRELTEHFNTTHISFCKQR